MDETRILPGMTGNTDPLAGLPLVMAYVPIQPWSQTYAAAVGLSRGTIFPALDLPFLRDRRDVR